MASGMRLIHRPSEERHMIEKDYILRVKDLRTEFKVGKRTVHAVNGATFDLERGKTLCVVGESGCGKSVTAHSIMQLLPPNGYIADGTIEYLPKAGEPCALNEYKRNGRAIREIRGKEIAMIFQDPMSTLNPVYTVGDQIMEMLKQHETIDRKTAKDRIIQMLADLGIPNPEIRYNQYPHEFSGGMKRRLSLLRALLVPFDLLILDEPFNGLDSENRKKTAALVRNRAQDKILLFAAHTKEDAALFGAEILCPFDSYCSV